MNTNSGTRKCGFLKGHNWGQWKIIARYNVYRDFNDSTKTNIGTGITQQRKCEDCGFTQINEQTDRI